MLSDFGIEVFLFRIIPKNSNISARLSKTSVKIRLMFVAILNKGNKRDEKDENIIQPAMILFI